MGVSAIPTPRQLIIHHPAATPPAGYIKANGAALDRTVYAWLFGQIGTTFGAGDGSTTFNVPDLRGVVARGLDDGRGLDSGRALGSYQADQIASHSVTVAITDPGHSHITSSNNVSGSARSANTQATGSNTTSTSNTATTGITASGSYTGGAETTMKNVALLACIAYAP